MNQEDFKTWLKNGVDRGWCSTMVCETHDGVPRTDAEEDAYQSGQDHCVNIVRIYLDTDLDQELNDSHR
jgi:hypothetical protein